MPQPGRAALQVVDRSQPVALKAFSRIAEVWSLTVEEAAGRAGVEVEVPFATVISGVVVRGRMDAVFAGPGGRYDVVDWKTGRQPTGVAEAAAAVQLAAYRLAWADLAGVPVEQVRAAFHYVRDGVTVRPADLLDRAGLAKLINDLPLLGDTSDS